MSAGETTPGGEVVGRSPHPYVSCGVPWAAFKDTAEGAVLDESPGVARWERTSARLADADGRVGLHVTITDESGHRPAGWLRMGPVGEWCSYQLDGASVRLVPATVPMRLSNSAKLLV